MQRRHRRAALAASLAAAALAWSAVEAAPARAGRYAAQLCVRVQASAPASCGDVDVDIAGANIAVRSADIAYRLIVRPGQVDVLTTQGKMQIDEFSAFYEWQGDTLSFVDPDKNVRYEVRLGAKKKRARR
ncbi:MAG: hypothetical protein ABI364_05395 [Caldimonas sp.]